MLRAASFALRRGSFLASTCRLALCAVPAPGCSPSPPLSWGRGFASGLGGEQVLPSPSKLDQVVDEAMLRGEGVDKIRDIWLEFHSTAGMGNEARVSAVLTAEEYGGIRKNMKASPIMVLPLPKPQEGEGAVLTMVVNHQSNVSLFTSLQEYQANPATAPFHFALTHYDELAGDKGVVLVRGDCVGRHVVDKGEGHHLMNLLYHFYSQPELYSYVEAFNGKSPNFDYYALLNKCKELAAAAADKVEGEGGDGGKGEPPAP